MKVIYDLRIQENFWESKHIEYQLRSLNNLSNINWHINTTRLLHFSILNVSIVQVWGTL